MPLTFANAVTPEKVRWLWPGYIPFGKVTILDGDPGLGKSTLMIDLAGKLSRGEPLPNGKRHTPMGTILMMGEDGAGDTIVPRLINAQADLERIGIRDTYTNDKQMEIPPAFPSDLKKLKEDIVAAQAGMVVIDPVMSYLDPDINSNNDQQVRRALMPLAMLAEETGAAIVLLRHLNKATGGSALYRGGGSIGFVGVARSALIVAHDPDDPTRVVLASTKSNLGPPPPALNYRLTGCVNGAARVDWEGHSTHTAETLVRDQGNDGERTAHDEACAFLRDLLGDHLPLLADELWKQTAQAGHARNTILRAKNTIGVVIAKARTQNGKWSWTWPESASRGKKPIPETEDSSDSSVSSDSSSYYEKNLMYPKNPKSTEAPPLGDSSRGREALLESIPRASRSGRGFVCAVCGGVLFAIEGKPLLCKACAASVAAQGAD